MTLEEAEREVKKLLSDLAFAALDQYFMKGWIMITQEHLDNWFTYHSPTPEQTTAYIDIRNAAKHFAEIVLANTPPSADQTAAIRKIREAVMTANASIACGGK